MMTRDDGGRDGDAERRCPTSCARCGSRILRRSRLQRDDDVLARGVVVAGDEQQQVALLMAVERAKPVGVDLVGGGAASAAARRAGDRPGS